MSVIYKRKWFKYVSSVLIICLLFAAYRIYTVKGEESNPKFVLMRLEDIGPGGQYATMEQLGKLRTVLEYLHEQHAAYHLAVVPRWINLPPDGSRYDVSLDQANNPYVEAYQKVLKQAVQDGATLGLHGYTHQVGNVRRDDGHHESGIGNEFNEPGSVETQTAAYAEPRLREGLAIMDRAGLKPQFWEAPHYRSTPEQDEMFRSYFGLNYQADVQTNRNSPVGQYVNRRNIGYGAPSMGAAYVPTPFDYIPFNKDEKAIIDRVGKSQNIASFFFHPFLEFKHMVPVLDEQGTQVLRDGIPEFRYAAAGRSLLQKLVAGLQAKGYAFYSIQDYIPFTPAQSVKINASKQGDKVLLGDVTGDGQADVVNWDGKKGTMSVTPGSFQGRRNDPQQPSAVWANIPYADGAAAVLDNGTGGKGASNLWVTQPDGTIARFIPGGGRFVLQQSWTTEARSCSSLYVLPQKGGETVVAGLSKDHTTLYGYYISKGELKPLKPFKFKSELKNGLQVRALDESSKSLFYARPGAVSGLEVSFDKAALGWKLKKVEFNIPSEDGEIRFGDYNGDGKEDISRWNAQTRQISVYLRAEMDSYKLLSVFGPWGNSGSKLVTADLDGNAKTDIALIDRQDGYVDTALSYESQN